MFGGEVDITSQKTIAAFDTIKKEWARKGLLKRARHNFGVIKHEGDLLVVGGYSSESNEKCILKDGSIQCQLIKSQKDHSVYNPLMIHVSYDYCPE